MLKKPVWERTSGSMFFVANGSFACFDFIFLRKGQQWASQWQNSNCKIVMVDENCSDALSEYTKFVGQNIGSKTGKVLLGANIW